MNEIALFTDLKCMQSTADNMNSEVDEELPYYTRFIGVPPHDSRTLIVETYSVNRLRSGPVY